VALAARTITMPDRTDVMAALLRGALSAVLVVVGFGLLAYALDRRDTRPVVAGLADRAFRRRRERRMTRDGSPARDESPMRDDGRLRDSAEELRDSAGEG
jgi:hypothetical protein